jgi:hypothetical protein
MLGVGGRGVKRSLEGDPERFGGRRSEDPSDLKAKLLRMTAEARGSGPGTQGDFGPRERGAGDWATPVCCTQVCRRDRLPGPQAPRAPLVRPRPWAVPDLLGPQGLRAALAPDAGISIVGLSFAWFGNRLSNSSCRVCFVVRVSAGIL